MASEHDTALEEFLRVFDARISGAPVVERRAEKAGTETPSRLIDAQRSAGPVENGFAYWDSDKGRAA
jgi:hypothetical protein